MNRFTQQKPISKSVLSILVPVVVLFCRFFFCFFIPVSSISATTKQEEIENLKTGCYPQYHLLLCSGRNLSGKSFLSGEPLWNHL